MSFVQLEKKQVKKDVNPSSKKVCVVRDWCCVASDVASYLYVQGVFIKQFSIVLPDIFVKGRSKASVSCCYNVLV